VFTVGLTAEQNPSGIYAYIVSPGHAGATWDLRFAMTGDGRSAESFIFGGASLGYHPLRVVPPLVIGTPLLDSTLQRNLTRVNEVLSRLTDNYRDYYCPPHSNASPLEPNVSSCIPHL
jgi:hypothetical protein